MATTSDLTKGVILRFNGELHVLEEVQHRTPGNLRAFYQAKMRNLRNGKIVENRFRSGEEVQIVSTERKNYQYLYRDGTDFVLMDNGNYEQLTVSGEKIGEQSRFLKEGMEVDVVFSSDETIIQTEIPTFVNLKVTEADPTTKDDRATSGTKSAKLETGATIQVPMFVVEGDDIRIDTRTGEYMERIKK
ncbi:MAG: elongation factor P [Rhizobacter sp.]|nr:elongation factor P [Chlorobiales bacterium]